MNIPDIAVDLFGNLSPPIVKTESIKYAGSKLKLIPYILEAAAEINPRSVLDGFSGTTRVSQAFAQCGYDVSCSDISVWSSVLGTCYLKGQRPENYMDLIDYLNNVQPINGWFTDNYGGEADNKGKTKFPWQKHNTMKLDGIRKEIEKLNLPDVERAVALTSLMIGLDKVDSTLGHFTSYLKGWSSRSYNSLTLQVPKIIPSKGDHFVLCGDIFDIIKNRTFDFAYFDPPYGSNNEKMPPSRVRYASYYHLWTTICLNDTPSVFGAARRREDSRDTIAGSIFEEYRQDGDGEYIAVKAIKKLLREVNAHHILLSYSSGGRATAEELRSVIDEVGRLVSVREIDYKKNVMAGMRWTNDWIRDAEEKNLEFLFHIEKR